MAETPKGKAAATDWGDDCVTPASETPTPAKKMDKDPVFGDSVEDEHTVECIVDPSNGVVSVEPGMIKTTRDELNTKLFEVLDSHKEIHPKMTPFDRSKKKAIIFQGRMSGRDIKYANPYYDGTEGWTNIHYYRKHFITTPKYLAKRLAEVVKVVPGFNKEVKFYKRVTHDDGATETEPTTLDEIMQMDITMVLPPQPQSRRESELSRKLEAAYAEATAAKRQRT